MKMGSWKIKKIDPFEKKYITGEKMPDDKSSSNEPSENEKLMAEIKKMYFWIVGTWKSNWKIKKKIKCYKETSRNHRRWNKRILQIMISKDSKEFLEKTLNINVDGLTETELNLILHKIINCLKENIKIKQDDILNLKRQIFLKENEWRLKR